MFSMRSDRGETLHVLQLPKDVYHSAFACKVGHPPGWCGPLNECGSGIDRV